MKHRLNKTVVLILLAGMMLVAANASGQTTFYATDDTWLEQDDPFFVNGSDPELESLKAGGDNHRPVFLFDLASIPLGATVTSAQFQVFVTDFDNPGLPLNVHRVTAPWIEATATWNSHGNAYDNLTIHGTLDGATLGWVTADVTALVQDWVDGTYANNGLMVVSASNDNTTVIASSDTTNVVIRPTLTITYADPTEIRVATGSYTGDGAATQAINNVGFQPDFVLIKGSGSFNPIVRTASMSGDMSKDIRNSVAVQPNMIKSLDLDGFTVGSDADVNQPAALYYWTAIRGEPGAMATGSYTGNGNDDDNTLVSGLGFQPLYAIIMSESNEVAMQRFVDQAFDRSLAFFSDGEKGNRIQFFNAASIELGDHDTVNKPGIDYHYVTWGASPSGHDSGAYVGDGSVNHPVNTPGFQPDAVIVRRDGGSPAVHRPAELSGDATLRLDGGAVMSNAITTLQGSGFQVGSDDVVNKSGDLYYWTAFRDVVSAATTSDLGLVMSVDNVSPNEGDTVTYDLKLRNLGPDDAIGIVAEPLPAGVTYITDTATQGLYDPGLTLWGAGPVAAGDSASLSITVSVDAGTAGQTIVNSAAATHAGLEIDPNILNDKAFVALTVNGPPVVVAAMPDTTVVEDNPALADYRDLNDVFFDIEDGSVLLFNIVSNSNPSVVGATIDAADSTLDLSFAPNASGSSMMVISASDSGGLTVNDTFVVDVTSDNDAPVVVAAMPDTTVVEDSPPIVAYRDLNDVFGDVEDGTVLGFVIQSNSNPALVTPSISAVDSTLSMSVSSNVSGAATVVIRATDGGGLAADDTILVTVTADNDSPIVSSAVADTTVVEDNAALAAYRDLNSVFSDIEDGSALAFAIAGNDNPTLVIATINPADSALDLSFGADQSGSANIIIRATDSGALSVEDSLVVNVTAVNDTPIVALAIPDTTLSEDDSFVAYRDLNNVFADTEDMQALGFVVQANTNPALVSPSINAADSTLDLTLTANLSGSALITLRATDAGGLFRDDQFLLTVSSVNDVPSVVAPMPDTLVAQSSPPIIAYRDLNDVFADVEDGSALAFSVFHNSDPGVLTPSINPADSTLDLTFAVAQTGAVLLIIEAADSGGLSIWDTLTVFVDPSAELAYSTGSLYPATTFVGASQLALRLGVDNLTPIGVTLNTGSNVFFSDGTNDYQATLSNPTYVPPSASNFTLTFDAAPVPGGIAVPAYYDLRLELMGTDDQALGYADTLWTTGGDSLLVDTPRVRLTALPLDVEATQPGDSAPILMFDIVNEYGDTRFLDSLTVTNFSSGPGSPAQLDAEIRDLALYVDADTSGSVTGADTLLAQSVFAAGRATFDVSGAWAAMGGAQHRLIVSAQVDSTVAADGDRLDVVVSAPADVNFAAGTIVGADFSPLYPLDSFGRLVVDGMVGHQVATAPAIQDTLLSGTSDNLLFELTVPQNGYLADSLQALAISNAALDFTPSDFSAVRLYRDDGDGVFNAMTDVALGQFAYSGDRYQISGLSEPVASTQIFFVAADVASGATDDNNFAPVVPLSAIEMASGNDGPLDGAVAVAGVLTIRRDQRIDVTGIALPAQVPNPGDDNITLLLLRIENNTLAAATLDTLALNNVSVGPGTTAEIDADLSSVALYEDNGDGVVDAFDTLVANGLLFVGGQLTATGMGVDLAPGQVKHLLVAASVDSFCVRDDDSLRVAAPSAASFGFLQGVAIAATFPLSTGGTRVVDGMFAHQLQVTPRVDSLVVSAGPGALVFDLGIPANGYEPDSLNALDIQNMGTATSEHISIMQLFADGGDGIYDAGTGDDNLVGSFIEISPQRYRIESLVVPLSAACGSHTRFFVAADIRSDYSVGGSIQFSVPTGGVEVASGNDGPLDGPVTDTSTLVIPKPDQLTIFPYSVGDQTVAPNSDRVLNFGIGFYNGYSFAVQLDELKLFQSGTASSSDMDSIYAYADVDKNGLFEPSVDSLLVALPSSGASYTFSIGGLDLSPQKVSYVFVAYDVRLNTTDSVSIDLKMFDAAGLTVSPAGTAIEGEFPLNSPGVDYTNGMIAEQIVMTTAPAFRTAPGDADVLALDVTLPGNGTWPDVLDFFSVLNLGTGVSGTDISSFVLWKEVGGDPNAFDPVNDVALGFLNWNGTTWTNAAPLNESIPVTGKHFYATFSVALSPTDGVTVRAALPLNGVQMTSGNDGPIDTPVANDREQVISTDPLITSLEIDRSSYSVGQAIDVLMTIRNEGPDSLIGIQPSLLGEVGSGSVSIVVGPVPVVIDLAAGEDSTFTWQYTADSAGDISFCANAVTADSLAISQQTCSEAAVIENRALGVSLVLSNFAPSSANRSQNNVPLAQATFSYDAYDTLAAVVQVHALVVSVQDDGGGPLIPDTVLDRMSIIAANGINESFAVLATNPLILQPQTPIFIYASDSLALDLMCDVADSAVFTSFQISIAALTDIDVVDGNDGLSVPLFTGIGFPWNTTSIVVNDKADSILVTAPTPTTVLTNTGQDAVPVLTLTLRNAGGVNTADEIVTDLELAFFDTTGAPLAPGAVIQELEIRSAGQLLHAVDNVPLIGNTIDVNLNTPMVVTPGTAGAIDIVVDTRGIPQSEAFYLSVEDESALVARDINSGQLVVVTADTGTSFPILSNTVVFETPATSLLVDYQDHMPSSVLPLTAAVQVMEVSFTHPDTGSSAVLIDSLSLEFVDNNDDSVFPGDYFSRLYIVHGADTVSVNTSLSGALPYGTAKLSPALLIPAGSVESISVFLDAKNFFSPVNLRIRLDQTAIIALDANAGTRLFGLSGPFPFVSGPADLQIASSLVQCGMNSLLPANITATSPDLEAFELVVENSHPVGHTPVKVMLVRVGVEDATGVSLSPDDIVTGASLMVDDVAVASGQIGSQEILFDVSSNNVLVTSSTTETMTVIVNVNSKTSNRSLRFTVRDDTATDMVDAVTGSPITVGTIDNVGYPLQTNLTTILGNNINDGFTNYPNPFAAGRESTRITYFVEQPSTVTLDLYTIWGAHVATLVENRSVQRGLYQDIAWDGRNGEGNVVNNGVYYMLLRVTSADGGQSTVKRKVGVIR